MPYRDEVRALEARRDALEEELADVRHQLHVRKKLPVLAAPRIPSPCDVPWAAMEGDDRVRLCGQCARYVYNLSAMTGAEAAELLAREPRLCVRYYERADGTILTSDCAIGARKRRIRRVKAAAPAAIVAASLAAMCASNASSIQPIPLYTIDEVVATRPKGEVRAEGDLALGSLGIGAKEARFVLASKDASISVRYASAVVPDTLRDGAGIPPRVLVEGVLGDDGVFHAEHILVKTPNQGYRSD
jgi:cytochrome c-type biogenesis protein CcmE